MSLNSWFCIAIALIMISILLEPIFSLKCLCGAKGSEECGFSCDDPEDVCFKAYKISDKQMLNKSCGSGFAENSDGVNKCKDYTMEEWKKFEETVRQIPVGDETSEKLKREIRDLLEELPDSQQDLKKEIEDKLDTQDLDAPTLLFIKGKVKMALMKAKSKARTQDSKAIRFCTCNSSDLCNTDEVPPTEKSGKSGGTGAKWISGFVFGSAVIISLTRPKLGF